MLVLVKSTLTIVAVIDFLFASLKSFRSMLISLSETWNVAVSVLFNNRVAIYFETLRSVNVTVIPSLIIWLTKSPNIVMSMSSVLSCKAAFRKWFFFFSFLSTVSTGSRLWIIPVTLTISYSSDSLLIRAMVTNWRFFSVFRKLGWTSRNDV